MKKIYYVLIALMAGATLVAAMKRAELGDRLDGVANMLSGGEKSGSNTSTWLNHNPFNNFNNWPNY